MGRHSRNDDAEGRPNQPAFGAHVDTERQPTAKTDRGGRLVDLLSDDLFSGDTGDAERGGRYDQQ